MEELDKKEECIIIYSKSDLTDEFINIISCYGNIVTDIKNKQYKVVSIFFKDIIMLADPWCS